MKYSKINESQQIMLFQLVIEILQAKTSINLVVY